MEHLTLRPIGRVRSPYKVPGDAPRQGRFSDTVSEIIIDDAFLPGLRDLAAKKHIIVLSWFDRSDRSMLAATPPGDTKEHGVFATRSPNRPNPVGLCVVDLISIKGPVLTVRGLDSLDGTPVIDIEPYSPEIDCVR